MENKYYTPEIEEFHVGFEFEVNYGKGRWVKEGLYYKPQVVTLPYKNLENIRVKHLDREDIEELLFPLGFKKDTYNDSYINGDIYAIGTFSVLFEDGGYLMITKYHFQGDLSHNNKSFAFVGQLKNKSELKKLLKQLKI